MQYVIIILQDPEDSVCKLRKSIYRQAETKWQT